MKKLFLLLCFGCAVNLTHAQDQTLHQSIQDKHHTVLGYIKGGVITDANNNFLGEYKKVPGMLSISDKHHTVIGYMVDEKEIQDANHKTIGYLKNDGKGINTITASDAQGNVLGSVNYVTGAITDKYHDLVGYEVSTEPCWVAPYYFFFKF